LGGGFMQTKRFQSALIATIACLGLLHLFSAAPAFAGTCPCSDDAYCESIEPGTSCNTDDHLCHSAAGQALNVCDGQGNPPSSSGGGFDPNDYCACGAGQNQCPEGANCSVYQEGMFCTDAGGAPLGHDCNATSGGGGQTSGGQTSGGQTSGGQTSGGQTSGGQTSGGQTSGGQTSGGQTSGGQTSGGQTSGGQTSGGQTSGGQTSGGQTSGGQTSGGQTSGGQTSGGQASSGQASSGQAASSGSSGIGANCTADCNYYLRKVTELGGVVDANNQVNMTATHENLVTNHYCPEDESDPPVPDCSYIEPLITRTMGQYTACETMIHSPSCSDNPATGVPPNGGAATPGAGKTFFNQNQGSGKAMGGAHPAPITGAAEAPWPTYQQPPSGTSSGGSSGSSGGGSGGASGSSGGSSGSASGSSGGSSGGAGGSSGFSGGSSGFSGGSSGFRFPGGSSGGSSGVVFF
jgi:hypothetical protein